MTQIEQIIQPSFHHAWGCLNGNRYTSIVFKGGRNSGKSTVVSLWIIARLSDTRAFPVNALVVRKVGETLHDSVFEQLKEAVSILGLDSIWIYRENPLSMQNRITGSRIIFRGADKPEKIKSIKTAGIPIAVLWIEELAEFRMEEELDTIVSSVVRASLPSGLKYKLIYSYNPPKRKSNWVNRKFNTTFLPATTFVHSSTYKDNPHLSKEAIEEIEYDRINNPVKYQWKWEGQTVDSGVVPFSNLNFRTISDEEISHFDNYKQGLDWGYAADPLAIVICHYDRTRRILYVFDEYYGVKIPNESAAEWLQAKHYHTTYTTADSAEPKSIDELRTRGVRIRGAVKGKGSVETGEKWLDELESIVIDPARCPNTAREFENISYQLDKDGNIISRLEDKDNHTIDAVRYAVEDEIGKHSMPSPILISGGGI